MEPTRTYIFVRLWEDFPDDLDISKFEAVLRPDFGIQLDRVAAAWIRANLNGPKDGAFEAWAAEQPEPEPDFMALINPDLHHRIGITYLLHGARTQGSPRHPQWVLIHAESTLDRANDLAEALEARMRVGCRFEVALVPQSTQKPAVWLSYERDLEEWDAKHVDIREIGFGVVKFKSPLRRLREEALKLSPHLSPASGSARPEDVPVGAPQRPNDQPTQEPSGSTSTSVRAGKGKDRRPPPRVLGTGHREILAALERAGVTSLEKRLKGPELAKKAFGSGAGAETVKSPCAELVQWGFAGSHPGPEGGYWITPKGLRRLHADEK